MEYNADGSFSFPKLNGFNNGIDASDGVGGREGLEENMKWCAENMQIKEEKEKIEKDKYLNKYGV